MLKMYSLLAISYLSPICTHTHLQMYTHIHVLPMRQYTLHTDHLYLRDGEFYSPNAVSVSPSETFCFDGFVRQHLESIHLVFPNIHFHHIKVRVLSARIVQL